MSSTRRISVALALALGLHATPALSQDASRDVAESAVDGGALDLSTPRASLASFLAATRDNRWDVAAGALDLREVPSERRAEVGARVARDLAAVLETTGTHPDSLADEPHPAGERAVEVVRVAGVEQSVVLRRQSQDRVISWTFTPGTVRWASALAAGVDRGPIGRHVPRVLVEHRAAGLEAWQWIGLVIAAALALLLGALGVRGVAGAACRIARREHRAAVEAGFARLRGPLRLLATLGAFGVGATLLRLPDDALPWLGRAYVLAWFLGAAWLFARAVDLGAQTIADRAALADGWRSRGVRTRVMILRRVVHVIGIVVVVAAALMQFESVREIGVSLLASAGVAGIVVGLAAQRTIGNVLAGIQLSLTQPLRVGDSVVVEKEFGTVEEITLSYVVVALWDKRRLIVPMTKLLESPFENWTRVTTELIGEISVPVDFATPFDVVRREIERYVRGHKLFDGQTFAVQVVGAGDRSATLRVLVSAADAGKLFELRCDVRERLIGLLQKLDRGRYLPHVRVGQTEVEDAEAAAASQAS